VNDSMPGAGKMTGGRSLYYSKPVAQVQPCHTGALRPGLVLSVGRGRFGAWNECTRWSLGSPWSG
jgi:hypothetical protein